jgi:spore coat protein U-like protein
MMMVIAMVSGAFAAQATVSVNATATVTSICNVHGGTLPFGTVNADGVDVTVDAAGGISIQCTKGTSVAITNDGGLNGGSGKNLFMDGGTTTKLPYSIDYNTPLTGDGAAGTNIGAKGTGLLSLTGTVTHSAAEGVIAGNYSDTLVLTLSY